MVKVPSNQSNIVHFFKLVKPLAEGCIFTIVEQTCKKVDQRVKLEVLPRMLHKIQILEANVNQCLLKQIYIQDLDTVSLVPETIKTVEKFKGEPSAEYSFKF